MPAAVGPRPSNGPTPSPAPTDLARADHLPPATPDLTWDAGTPGAASLCYSIPRRTLPRQSEEAGSWPPTTGPWRPSFPERGRVDVFGR